MQLVTEVVWWVEGMDVDRWIETFTYDQEWWVDVGEIVVKVRE